MIPRGNGAGALMTRLRSTDGSMTILTTGVLVVILMIKPYGLFGTHEIERL